MRNILLMQKTDRRPLKAARWLQVLGVVCATIIILISAHARATTTGKMTLYFHKEASDANETYNSLSLTPPEPAADTAPGTLTSSTAVNATPPTSFCESTDGQTDAQNERITTAASTGNFCAGTFISMPIGNAISLSTGDTNAITSQLWSSESATQATVALNVYLYRWNGSGTTVVAGDRIATLTCADPGTAATTCSITATPANNITFAATDRIVAIVSLNVTGSRSGANTNFYMDSTGRTATSVTLKYTALSYNTTNKPNLTGTLDDDFTTAAATTACTTGGVAYNTKWTCLQGTNSNTAGAFNAEDTSAAGSGDSSSWIWLRNQTTATSAVTGDFGASPSNTFLYQSMPTSYGSGAITTVLNSSATFGVGATNPSSPYNHAGLVLWKSNTDYLELQVYASGATTGTNSVNVVLNNSGSLGTATSLNASTTSGVFSEVWLRFSNTNGSWQAQYSTDGTTWNNVGGAVSHGIFTRVGLNAFSAVANPVSSYAGAFEWFSSTLSSTTSYDQKSYRFFSDNAANSPLATEHTAASLTSTGQEFHMRMLINETGQSATSADQFKLQVAPLGGAANCSLVNSANYTDVGVQPITTSGPNLATTANGAYLGGNTAWTNASNALTENGSVASVSLTTSTHSDYLGTTGYGFSIPSTATITGILVEAKLSGSGGTPIDNSVRLIKGGSLLLSTDSNLASPGFSTGTLTYSSHGGSTTLWNDTWTPADINSSGFGVGIDAVNSSASTITANIDNIRITVYYATGSGTIAYQTTGNNGVSFSPRPNDPTDSSQTVQAESYVESNNFSNNWAETGGTIDGEWDFNLIDDGATAGTSYCFRAVKSSGTTFSNYTYYPMITTYVPGPSLDQVMRGGNWFSSSGVEQSFYWAQ